MDVREHTAASDGHAAKELVELLVVAHSELHVARDDARLLVVAGSVARKLKDFSAKVLEHSRGTQERRRQRGWRTCPS